MEVLGRLSEFQANGLGGHGEKKQIFMSILTDSAPLRIQNESSVGMYIEDDGHGSLDSLTTLHECGILGYHVVLSRNVTHMLAPSRQHMSCRES